MAYVRADDSLASHRQTRWMLLWHDLRQPEGCTGSELPSNCSGDDGGHCVVPLARRIHLECVPWMLVARGPVYGTVRQQIHMSYVINLRTVVPQDPTHFGLAGLASCHGVAQALPLLRLNPPPPWQSQGEDSQLMYLERRKITVKEIQKLLTSDGFHIRIWCLSVCIPDLDHFLPFPYGVTWKGGSKFIVVFLLPLRHHHGLLE